MRTSRVRVCNIVSLTLLQVVQKIYFVEINGIFDSMVVKLYYCNILKITASKQFYNQKSLNQKLIWVYLDLSETN